MECPSCGRYVNTNPIASDALTLRVSHDKAREQLRALEGIISDVDEFVSALRAKAATAEIEAMHSNLRGVESLRDALHAALYCPVVP